MTVSLAQYGLSIEGSGLSGADLKDFEAQVGGLVTLLSLFAVPRAVFLKLKAHGRVLGGTKIQPRSAQEADRDGVCNATGFDPNKDRTDFGFWNPGKATVHFSPQAWSSGSCGAGAGSRPDEVLLHELVHAARFMGRDDVSPKPLRRSMAGYHDEEEFFAILITNIYISETGRNSLRRDHNSTLSLAPAMTNPETFLDVPGHYQLIEKFCSQHPNIAPMIAKANAAFNPIKAYYSKHWYSRYKVK